jgi:hypothetical protein
VGPRDHIEPESSIASPGSSPLRPRHGKAPSAEFKTSREFRPLYLLELLDRKRKSDEIDEVLPALPPSASPSLASSTTETDTEAEYESALESPRPSDNVTPNDTFFAPFDVVSDLISSQPGPELQHPELADREIEEIEGSGQVTPRASAFAVGAQPESAGPAREELTAALEDVKAKNWDLLLEEHLAKRSTSPRPASPLAPSAPLDDTKMRDMSTPGSRDASPAKSSFRLQTAAFGAAIGGLAAAVLRNRSQSPSREPKSATEPTLEPEADTSESRKGKGKAKKRRGKNLSISSTLVGEPDAQDPKQFIPTFNDNEDDWAKNKSESVVTDDATLVGESVVGEKEKGRQAEKVLESTRPQGDGAVEVRRVDLANAPTERDIPTVSAEILAPKEDLEKTLADIKPEQEPVEEQAAASSSKAKKVKKSKQGKRGSQQVEPEPEPITLKDEALPAPETQQKVIEREILEPSLTPTEEGKKVNVMDFLEKDDEQVIPVAEEQAREIAAEPSATAQTTKDIAPEIAIAEPIVPVPEHLTSAVKAVEQPAPVVKAVEPLVPTVKPVEPPKAPVQEPPAAQSPESSKSGWGSSLLGAIGWGKKRATSPTPTVAPKPVPVVEEKKEVPVVAPVESKTEAKRKSLILEQLELARKAKATKAVVAEPEEKKDTQAIAPIESAPTEATRDTIASPVPEQLETKPFVAPQTAYFSDGGKPAFTFPAFKPTPKEESVVDNIVTERAVEDVLPDSKDDVVKETEPTRLAVMPQSSFFTDDGKPYFAFPQKATQDIAQPPVDTVVSERALDNLPSTVLPEPSEAPKEAKSAFVMPQASYFADDGKPHFTFPQVSTQATPEPTSTLATEEAESAEQAPVTKKKSKKDKKKRGSVIAPASEVVEPDTTIPAPTPIEETSSQVEQRSDDLVKDTPAVDETAVLLREAEPEVAPIEEAVPSNTPIISESTAPVSSIPIEEVVTPKKKGKKAKKAKRDSEPSTPIVERSLDLSVAGPSDITGVDVPLPLERLGEVEELAERVLDVAPTSTQLETATDVVSEPLPTTQNVVAEPAQDVQVESARDITETAPAEEDWGFTPKTKKSKKNKGKSVEVQAEPAIGQPIPTTEPSVSEVVDVSVLEAKPLVATERSLEVDPTPEVVLTPVEQTVETEPASKKDKKKKKGKKAKGTDTPVEDVVQPEPSIAVETVTQPEPSTTVVEQVIRPEDVKLPEDVDGELEDVSIEAPVAEAKQQDDNPAAENMSVLPQPETVSESMTRDVSAPITTPAFIAPQTSFFTDNGKPHFSFPTQSTAAISSESTQTEDVPTIEEQFAPAEAIEEQAVPAIIQTSETPAEADLVSPTTSKKDKKKKKGKKSKVAEESEPSTPVAEVQRELGESVEGVKPKPSTPITEVERELQAPVDSVKSESELQTLPSVTEQAVEEAKQPESVAEEQPVLASQPESTVDNVAVVEDQPILASQASEPVADVSAPVLNEPVASVVEEPSTPSKKPKKKKGKKDKSVDVEPTVAEASTVVAPSIEPAAAQSVVEPQEIPLPLETPDELVQEELSREVGETVVEPVVEEAQTTEPILQEPVVGPVVEESIAEKPVVEEPIVEKPVVEEPATEEPVATSKKDKKKKGKKSKSIDIGPSTIDVPAVTTETGPPVDTATAEPTIVAPPTSALESVLETLAPSAEVAQAPLFEPTNEATILEDTLPVQDAASREIVEPVVEEEPITTSKKSKKKKGKKGAAIDTEPSTPVTEEATLRFDEPASTEKVELVPEPAQQEASSDGPAITTEAPEPAKVEEPVDITSSVPVEEPDQTEKSVDPTPSVAVEEPTLDTAASTAIEPTIENEDAELTSKKAKKKKGKKAKSTDITEPSTPITEETKQLEIPSEITPVEKSIDVTQPATEKPATELPKEPATIEPVPEASSEVKVEESATALPVIEEPTQEATEPSMPLEQAVETESAELSSKKAKKKKDKKAKASEDKAVEPTPEPIKDVPATDAMLDMKPVEEPAQVSQPAIVEAPIETGTVGSKSVPTSTSEAPVERELVTESPETEAQALPELAVLEDVTTTPQPEASIDNDEASSISKKAKKKKGKKNKSISEPQTPITEVESFIPVTTVADDVEVIATPVQEPVVHKEDAQVEPETLSQSIETQIAEQVTTQPDELAPAIEESARDIEVPSAVPEEVTEQLGDSTTEAPVSKKDKKKAKKNKRVSIVEEASSSTPATPVEQLPRELESQEIAAGVSLPEDSTVSQPVSPKTKLVDDPQVEPVLPTTTLDDSIVSQPPVVLETERSTDDQGVPTQQAETVVAESEPAQPVEDDTTTSKKGKKKAKKDKRKSITEDEPSTPLETPTAEVQQPIFTEQPVSVPEVLRESSREAVSTSVDLEPTPIVQGPEESKDLATEVLQDEQPIPVPQQPEQAADEETATPPKKDKKKAKKNKRVSIAEPESVTATPVEEKTSFVEDTPVPVPQLPEAAQGEGLSSAVDVQPSTSSVVVEEPREVAIEAPLEPATLVAEEAQQPQPTTAVVEDVQQTQPISAAMEDVHQPQQIPEDDSTPTSKKDKKKSKKAKRVSIAEPESTPATPIEEKAEPEIPVQEAAPVVTEPSAPVDEPVSKDILVEAPIAVVEETKLVTAEDEPATPLSKKDKKKAKKAKSGTATPVEEKTQEAFEVPVVEESMTIAPLPEEVPKDRVLDTAVVEEKVAETPAAEEPIAVAPLSEELPKEEETAPTSKKDKKKSKKAAKRGSIAGSEASESVAPVEQPIEETKDVATADQSIAAPAQRDEPTLSVTETAKLQSSEPLVEQTRDIAKEDQPLATPLAVEESIVAAPEEIQPAKDSVQEEASSAPLSKKDKKKGKKAKRESVAELEPSEPSTPIEATIEEARDVSAADEHLTTPMVVEEPAVIEPINEPEVSLPDTELISKADESKYVQQQIVTDVPETPVALVDEKALPATSIAEVPQPSEPVLDQKTTESALPAAEEAEPAEWANLSKAQKKKAKKAKRGSVAETEPSQPATPAEELPRELTLEAEPSTTQVVDEPKTAVEQHEVVPTAVEAPVEVVEESSAKSKKDKKKKKSKSVSILEDEASQPATPVDELPKELALEAEPTQAVNEPSIPVQEPEVLPAAVEVPVEVVEESSAKSKKDKKKKKSKSVSILEGESSQPATPVEELPRELTLDAEPAAAPAIEDLTSELKPVEEEPTTVTQVEELSVEPTPSVEDSASASLSKKDKKKAKRAKRTSGIEESPSQPATPIEEVTSELVYSPQPATPVAADLPSQEEKPLATDAIPPDLPDIVPAEPGTPSKKDKKKAKKAKSSATEQPVPFLAHETSEEANVSETQPSPPPSKPSETHNLLLSGIPTSYPHVSDSAFVVSGDESGRDVKEVEEEKVDVDEKNMKMEKKDESGVVGEEIVGTENIVDVVETTPSEPTAMEQKKPAAEPATIPHKEILPEQSTAPIETPAVQAPEPQPIEESKAVPEEPTTQVPAEPEEKKVKKHKLAALFEQKTAEDKPVLPRKRAPWAKPVAETSTVGESSKDVATVQPEPVVAAEKKAEAKEEAFLPRDVVVETPALEPAVATEEIKKGGEEIALPKDGAIETPAPEHAITTKESTKTTEAIAQPQDIATDTLAPEPDTTVAHSETPAQSTETTLDVATEQPAVPPADMPQPLEAGIEAESSLLSKKDKKKAKKNKKQSGTANPAEAVPEIPITPLEEAIATKTEVVEPENAAAVEPIVEREVPIESKEPQPEIPEIPDKVQIPEAASIEPQETIPEQVQETPIEIEKPSEPEAIVSDVLVDTPSKKDKKKSKKAKKQSESAAPAEEPLSEVQQETIEERAVPEIEQTITESVAETAPALEEAIVPAPEPATTDKTIDTLQETLPVAAAPIIETPQQEDVQPAAEASIEVALPTEEDSTVKLSKKDKKKGKKAKKQSEPATPLTEDLPEIVQEQVKEAAVKSLDQPPVEPVEEKAIELLVEVVQPTAIEEPAETPQHDNALPIAEVIPEILPTTSDANVEPSQRAEDDWGYTPPKKDKKKSKKGKKTDVDTAPAEVTTEAPREMVESKVEPGQEIIEQPQLSVDNTIVLDNAPVDIPEAGPLPDTSLPVVKTEDNVDPEPKIERALEAITTDITESTPLPTPALEAETLLEEELSAPLSKKDKKKGKKAKKASGTATPIIEEVPVSQPEPSRELPIAEASAPEKPAEELPTVVLDKEPVVEQLREIEQAEPTSTLITETQPLVDEAVVSAPPASTQETADTKEVILDDKLIAAATEEVPIVKGSREVEQPIPEPAVAERVQEEPASPTVSKKKSKKKAKKSELATPVVEDAPVPEVEATRELETESTIVDKAPVVEEVPTFTVPAIEDAPVPQVELPQETKPEPQSDPVTEPTTVDHAPLVENIPTPATQAEPMVEEQRAAPPAPQETTIETVIEEQTPPLTSKKSKKKVKKSGTAIPAVDDAPVPELEPAKEPESTTISDKIVEPTPEVQDVVTEASRDLPEIEAPAVPAFTEPEPTISEAEVSMPSKKSKKKGKKSGSATPAFEDVPQALPEDVLPPVEEAFITDREVIATPEHIVEEPAKQDDVPVTTESLHVPEPVEVVIPIEPKDKDIVVPEQLSTIEPSTEDIATSSSSKKKKGKKSKDKHSELSTPIIERNDPIDTVTRTISEDVQQVPVADVQVQPSMPETTTATEVVPLETTEESAVVEKPVLERKLSKKEKKAQEKAIAAVMDNEPLVSKEPLVDNVVEAVPAPGAVEPVPVDEPQQMSLAEEAQAPAVDEIATMPTDDQTLEDASIPAPKGKKAKKDKKKKTQSVSETVEQPQDDKPLAESTTNEPLQPTETHAGASTSRDLQSTLPALIDNAVPEPSQAVLAHTPSTQVHDFAEREIEQSITPEQPQALETSNLPAVKDAEEAEPLSRKASKKAKKGRKDKDGITEPFVVDEPVETPAIVEPVETPSIIETTRDLLLDIPARTEQLDTPSLREASGQKLPSEPTAIDLPAYEKAVELVPQFFEKEHASVPETIEPAVETTVETEAPEEVAKISKKDKKKGKKSKSTSGIATPIEAVPESAVVPENTTSDHAEPTIVEESSRDAPPLEEPQVTVTEVSDVQALPESVPTPVAETVEEATVSTQELTSEPQQDSIETNEPDLSLSSSTSKKAKKKKSKKTETAAEEPEPERSMLPALISEAQSEIVQEPMEILPTIAEATLDAKRSPSPLAFEMTKPLPEVDPTEEPAIETSRDIVEHSQENQDKTDEKVQPPVALSPDLKAIQDEVADLKLRSEALDQALVASEQLDEPSPSEPQSIFDIVGKLSKKDKKKGKKAKGTAFDSEPTTPAAESAAAVETKEIVEEATLAEIPSPKLSKKDKKKAKQGSVSWEEPLEKPVDEVVVEKQEPIVEPAQTEAETVTETTTSQPIAKPEAPVVSVEEVSQTPLEEPIAPIENITSVQPIEAQEPSVEERPSLLRKLSKKDKKKGKQIAQEDDVPSPQPETSVPVTSVETRDIITTEEPQPAPVVEASEPPATLQETVVEEERPAMSRKLSKKDKKKQAKTAPLAEDEPMLEPQTTVPETTTETREVTMLDEPTIAEPVPVVEEPIIPVSVPEAAADERPSLSRKLSKNDKKKGKQAQVIADEPVKSVADIAPLPVVQETIKDTPVVEAPEVQDTVHHSDTRKAVVDPIETAITGEITDPVVHTESAVPTTARELQADNAPIAPILDDASALALARKQSKKDKKKGKKSVLADESIESASEPEVKTRDIHKAVEPLAELHQPSAPRAAIVEAVVSKQAKEEKRKSKTATALREAPIEESVSSTSREALVEPIVALEPVLPETPVERERDLPTKKGKKEKSTSKLTIAPDVLPQKESASISRDVVQEDPFTTSTPTSTREVIEEATTKPRVAKPIGDPSPREPPTLNKKPSKTHKLAAMFEQGASQGDLAAGRELRKGGNGSVKNLAEQFETQSRSTTPVLQPTEKRTFTRLASEIRQDSQSPKKDIDFAGTLAAGLKLSGFDDEYVVNDPNFHRSNSPRSSRDITTEDDVEAALSSASTSKFAGKGWTTPTSSPKLRPRKEPESTTLPPIEVAMTSTDAISFDPLDVLNDPTFAKQTASPRALEEADPDELGSKLKMNKKSKGKKKRASLPESPVEADQSRTVPSAEQPPATLEEDQENVTVRKSKSKKDKQRASQTLDSVETAAETPAVEAFTNEPPAVETRTIDSTARGSKLEETLPSTSGVIPLDRSLVEDQTTVPTTGKELGEYPFPQVVVPDKTATRSVEEKPVKVRQEDQEEVEQLVKSSKKKDKKSKARQEETDQLEESSKVKDKKSKRVKETKEKPVEMERSLDGPSLAQDTTTHETHKRRSHPVTFEEAQPYEKRPHLQEPMPETHPTEAGPSSAPAPSWSFAGIRDNVEEVADPSIEASAPARDSAREKKRRSKESKTSHDSSRDVDSTDKEISESSETRKKRHSKSREEQSGEIEQKEPYQSIFGDPSEKSAGPSAHPITPASKHGRSLSNKQLDTITETSPEDQHAHKKGRAINDVGAPERGTKSLRRAASPQLIERMKSPSLGTPTPLLRRAASPNPIERLTSPQPTTSSPPLRRVASPQVIERMKSPVPVTPAPHSRKAISTAADKSPSKSSPSTDTPLHQMNDKVDRTMTLSPARRLPRSSPSTSFDPVKQQMAEQRSPSVVSQRSMSNISRFRSPDQERPPSAASVRSSANLRRSERSISGDLRAVARLGEANAQDANESEPNLSSIALAAGASAAIAGIAGASNYDPVRGAGKGRTASMVAETFVSPILVAMVVAQKANSVQEAWGEVPRSPMSPTRPPSVRKRQSIQIMDLQGQLDQLAAHNSSLENAKARVEETLQAAQYQRQIDEQVVAEAAEARDREIRQRDIDIAQLKDTLQRLREEIARLTELNNTLTEANRNLINDTNERYAQLQAEGQLAQQQSERYAELQAEGQLVQQQWQQSQRELEQLRKQHETMTRGIEGTVRDEIGIALDDRNAEIDRLNAELAKAKDEIKTLQKQILASKKPAESFLTIRDEDYFDSACQQLCQHVQQWVLRFSKFSDTRPCRLTSEIAADTRIDTATRQKIDTRLDNAILDGSDVDSLLADRVKRRDVFMSVVMTMIWEYVFTRYLFGMDREQRQKLKSLEKTLSEVGPPRAVAQWRAITLTLLSRRETFMQQRAQDTEAVVHEIYSTLSTLLSPPSHLQKQIQESLRNVMRLAVELSIEMRTQRAEYIMLPPLQPEYDTNGDLVAKVTFNASLMNERSGRETSNDELEARGAIVKIVLFPLVVKKGDDFGEGEDEIVVCPAQVLVTRPKDKKVVRMLSGAMSIDRPDSRASRMTGVTSVVPESTIYDYHGGGNNMI